MIAPPLDVPMTMSPAAHRVTGGVSATTYSLLTQATYCAIERDAMLTSNQMVTLSADMRAYLEYEAARRGVDIATVYEEESAAEKRARASALSREELEVLARESKPASWLLQGDEECPF